MLAAEPDQASDTVPAAETGTSAEPEAADAAGDADVVTAAGPVGGHEAGAGAVAVPAARTAGPVEGAGPWARCFTETLRPAAATQDLPPRLPRRLYAAARSPELSDLSGLFSADPAAPRTLAIIEDPADDRSRITAVDAACDAVSTGELVVITTSADFTGFFATLHAEHPSLGVTVLRVPGRGTSPAVVLEHAHAERGRFRELVVGRDGAVSEPVLTEFALGGRAQCPVGPDDVILVSRQTRGAGLMLAQVLAAAGTGIAVIGRAEDHEDSELVAGLEQLRSAGARVGYEVIDLADAASLTAAVQRIEDRLGPVTAIAHASAPDGHVPCLSLTEPEHGRAAAEAANTLDRLAGAVRPGQLKLIITAGSVAGRYGLAGSGLHALASGALASRAAGLAAGAAGCRALHLDLPAWTAGGLGEPPELAAELAAADCPPMEVSIASRMLLKILMTADPPRRLALHGRIGGLASRPAPSVSQTELTSAGLRSGARFLRAVTAHYPGIELVAEARLSLASDPYLGDYRIDGLPVLPPVLALEALAQAASVLAGRPVRRAAKVTMSSPVLIPSAGEASLRVCTLRSGDTVVAVLRCADSSYLVDHARAEFSCAAETEQAQPAAFAAGTTALQPLAAGPSGLVDGAELYGPVCFQSGRFRRVALLPEVTARSGRALARGTDDLPWYPADSELAGTRFLLGSPGLNDAALQVLQACVPHRRIRAAGCDAVQFSGRVADGPVEIRAVAEPVRATPAPSAGLQLVVPGQPGAPAAETDGRARPAAAASAPAGPSAQADPAAAAPRPQTAAVVATTPAEMSAEERADMEIAERRPQSRKSRRAARRQQETVARHAAGGAGPAAKPKADAGQARHTTPPTSQITAEPATAAPATGGQNTADPAAAAPATAGQITAGPSLASQRWDIEAVDAAGHMLAAWRGVRLHDSGPLPRNAAWPPTLLSVFLERSAVELGLSEGLRVTVSCGQPDGSLPQLLTAIPAQAAPAGDRPGGLAAGRQPQHAASAPGTGLLSGFTLSVRAPVPVSCAWNAPEAGHRQPSNAGMVAGFARLRDELQELPAMLTARLEAVTACLAAEPGQAGQISLIRTAGDGWAVLTVGDVRIACAVVELSGVPGPVAVALMTGAPVRPGNGHRAGGLASLDTSDGRAATRSS